MRGLPLVYRLLDAGKLTIHELNIMIIEASDATVRRWLIAFRTEFRLW